MDQGLETTCNSPPCSGLGFAGSNQFTKKYFYRFMLRVIVWNTRDVPPDETSITGEEVSDMYIKGELYYLLQAVSFCSISVGVVR